jgi:hypothetical protein
VRTDRHSDTARVALTLSMAIGLHTDGALKDVPPTRGSRNSGASGLTRRGSSRARHRS